MNCPLQREETADVLLDYAAGRLDGASAAMLERHMGDCPRCAAFRTEQASVWDALDQWEPAPVSADFNRRLWQRIDASASAPWYTRLGYRQLAESLRFANWKPVFPLAAAALLVAGGFLLDHPGYKEARHKEVAPIISGQAVSITEADQLEQTLDDIQLLHQLDSVTSAADGSSKRM